MGAVVPLDQIEVVIEAAAADEMMTGQSKEPSATILPAAETVPPAKGEEEEILDLSLSNFRYPRARKQLILETIAGTTVSLGMVPEAVAFALTAKVSPMVGMQAAWIICLITSLFGGRPGVVCGATGAVAVLLPPVVEKYGPEGLFLCIMLAGIFQFALGLIGFGKFLIKMMPHPVMMGFCKGLAILIGMAQFNLMKIPGGGGVGRRLGGDVFGAFTQHDDAIAPWISGSEAFVFFVHIALTMGICQGFTLFMRTKELRQLSPVPYC
eukprot:g4027.t1